MYQKNILSEPLTALRDICFQLRYEAPLLHKYSPESISQLQHAWVNAYTPHKAYVYPSTKDLAYIKTLTFQQYYLPTQKDHIQLFDYTQPIDDILFRLDELDSKDGYDLIYLEVLTDALYHALDNPRTITTP